MKFAIQVNAAPWSTAAGQSAFRFAKAAIATGHPVQRVFFYQDGVYQMLSATAIDEAAYARVPPWSELARRHGVDLVLCIAALDRRGLEAGSFTTRAEAGGFRIAGLGLLMESALEADRLVVFGGG